MVAQQPVSEMQSQNKAKGQGVEQLVNISLQVPTFSAVQVDKTLLDMNVQSMLDDLQVNLMSQEVLQDISDYTEKSKATYLDLLKMTQMDFTEETEEVEPETQKKKKSIINESQRSQLNNNPYHHLKKELQRQSQPEEAFDMNTLVPEFVRQTGATEQEALFFLAATQKMESALQLYRDTKK